MDLNGIVVLLQTQGLRLLGGLGVLIIGFVLVHWLFKLIHRRPRTAHIDATLGGFLDSALRIVLYSLVILTAAGVMGVPLTSFVALLTSAGVAISLAMQGALSNVVGGLTLMMLKLLRAGDYVKIGDVEGTVWSIGVFYSELVTFDNRHISLPNSSLTNTAIINYTREGTRRLDVSYGVSYSSDMDHVFEVLKGVVRGAEGVLDVPAPEVHLVECAESSLKFSVRLWCKSSDYWRLYFYMMEEGKRALDRSGIEIPFPQVDVHIKER